MNQSTQPADVAGLIAQARRTNEPDSRGTIVEMLCVSLEAMQAELAAAREEAKHAEQLAWDNLQAAKAAQDQVRQLQEEYAKALYESEHWAAIAAKCSEKIGQLQEDAARLRKAMNPRDWTREMSRAWHSEIPDVTRAFDALNTAAALDAATKPEKGCATGEPTQS